MEHQKNFDKDQPKEFVEKLIKLNRTAKVVKGGRRFSFSALTVVGDQKGRVGFGFGKANDVTEAIRKSIDKAKRNLVTVPIKNGTIPHDILGKYKSSSVLLKPACSGTGIIAGGPVRAVLEAAGATGQKPAKRATVRSLGLKKINSCVEHEANPAIEGMIASVSHLVKVEEMN